jgi:hypothetical protein
LPLDRTFSLSPHDSGTKPIADGAVKCRSGRHLGNRTLPKAVRLDDEMTRTGLGGL